MYNTHTTPCADDKLKNYYLCADDDSIFVYAETESDLMHFIADEIKKAAESASRCCFAICPVKPRWADLTENEMSEAEFEEYENDSPWDTPSIFSFDSSNLI